MKGSVPGTWAPLPRILAYRSGRPLSTDAPAADAHIVADVSPGFSERSLAAHRWVTPPLSAANGTSRATGSHDAGMTVVAAIAAIVSVLAMAVWIGLMIWAARQDGRAQDEHEQAARDDRKDA